ncbi:transglycosylase domain-containing protein [Microbacterium arabinogalactanolyticum]|uniref:transglycosylase domain-containing protein n=1 Tax=Microbacterium arabinogalactanolyticum TaxID=69365 RepID=UPI00255719B5|nr:transglycosylase domain-containing protein [Microbacterium arabinogalactanolyticum]
MPQKNRTLKGVLGGLLGLVGLSAVAGVLATAAVTPAIAIAGVSGSQALSIFENLPDALNPSTPMEPTVFYATGADGKPFELARFFDQNRVPVTFNQVSPVMYDALLSSEDKSFYEHGGVNLGATVKAVYDNVRGTSSRGASTISQQFVKNVLIQKCEQDVSAGDPKYSEKLNACWNDATNATGAKGVERKLQEMRYAIQIEKDYSKNDILLGYLNIANFGGQTYGIEAAANYYFGTTAAKLTLDQAATLAGAVQNPNRFRFDKQGGSWTDKTGKARNSKEDGYADTKFRRNYVLDRMLIDGKITKKQHDEAVALPITPNIHSTTQGCQAAGQQGYFCQYVKNVIEDDKVFGATVGDRRDTLRRGGMSVYTSLDMRVQNAGNEAMAARVPTHLDDPNHVIAGSAVTLEASTGRILAIAQNTQFNESANANSTPGQSSLVYAADRDHGNSEGFQPGSSYKVFTLLDWLEKGHSVNETLDGRRSSLLPSSTYQTCGEPVTYSGSANISKNYGSVPGYVGTPMRFTAASLNSGFYAMAKDLDLCDINKVAERLGVHQGNMVPVTKTNTLYESILGSRNIAPIQMAGAYATIANKGVYCTPKAIDKIVGADGKEMPLPESSCTQVISPEVAATASYALHGVMNATGSAANTRDGIPMFGKTGTHQEIGTAMALSSTKTTTFVYVGKNGGKDFPIAKNFYKGKSLNTARFDIARALERAANKVYGGDALPSPDRNLTRQVLKDLPNVVGMSIEEATKTIEDAGFSVQVGAPVDSTVGAGLVATQTPGAGQAPGGTTVTLSPSTGNPPAANVPNVVGAKFSDAKKTLEDAGFSVDDKGCNGGTPVTAQNPPGGSPAPPGSTVSVVCIGNEH